MDSGAYAYPQVVVLSQQLKFIYLQTAEGSLAPDIAISREQVWRQGAHTIVDGNVIERLTISWLGIIGIVWEDAKN